MSGHEIIYRANPSLLEGKQGKLPKDAQGRYKVLVGAYNMRNTCGDKYIFTSRVQALFKSSKARTRADNNQLYGEPDHPELRDFVKRTRTHEEAVALYLDRLNHVPPDRQAHQIHDFWYEPLPDKVDGETVYGVYALITPLHPRQKDSLENPQENTAYSVRSFIDRYPSRCGGYLFEAKELITWDWVSNPGISMAGKYNTPGLESDGLLRFDDGMDVLINDGVFNHLEKLAQQSEALSETQGVESDNHVMLTTMVKDIAGWREVPDIGATLSRQWVLRSQSK